LRNERFRGAGFNPLKSLGPRNRSFRGFLYFQWLSRHLGSRRRCAALFPRRAPPSGTSCRHYGAVSVF
jgi:hypothetical protein